MKRKIYAVCLLLLTVVVLGGCAKSDYEDCDHEWSSTEQGGASCQEPIVLRYSCRRCGDSYEEMTDRYGDHAWVKQTEEGDYRKPTCRDEGYQDYHCTVCGSDDSQILPKDPNNHIWTENSTAMCGEEGHYHRTCSGCGKSESGTTLGLEHDLISHEGYDEDCDAYGYKPYVECLRCEYTTFEQLTSTKHHRIGWTILVQPTETTKGIRERYCSECDGYWREEIPETPYTDFLWYEDAADGVGLVVAGMDWGEAPDETVISIPLTHEGRPIVGIRENAFLGDTKIETLKTHGNLTKIGKSAFRGCTSLRTVELGEGLLEIGEECFSGCTSLRTASLPKSLDEINHALFRGCASLETLTIPFVGGSRTDGLTRYSLGSLFGTNNHEENSQYVPNSLKYLTVTDDQLVKFYSFYGCGSLVRITLPDTLDWQRGSGYDLTGCISLTFTEYEGGCYFSTPSNPYYMFVKPKDLTLTGFELHEDTFFINAKAFMGCSSLGAANIPGSVRVIGSQAFENCVALETVTMNSGTRYIRSGAFKNCTRLNALTLSDTLWEIREEAFKGCTNLTRVTIPASVDFIGAWAFMNTGLTYAKLGNSLGWYHSIKGFFRDSVEIERLENTTTMANYLTGETMVGGSWERSDSHI